MVVKNTFIEIQEVDKCAQMRRASAPCIKENPLFLLPSNNNAVESHVSSTHGLEEDNFGSMSWPLASSRKHFQNRGKEMKKNPVGKGEDEDNVVTTLVVRNI